MLRTSLKQPKELYLLFFTELWERFGYYTIQAILILFLTTGLKFTDHSANILYAAFSSLLYVTPIIGGFLADRYLGFKRAIIIGGLALLLGYLCTAVATKEMFLIGLCLLIVGNGFFKPNVSSMVGDLYGKDDQRRDSGFTIFYMGINIGSMIPSLIIGSIVAWYGWQSGFLLAAVGMAIGMITFSISSHKLTAFGKIPTTSPLLKSRKQALRLYSYILIGIFVVLVLARLALAHPQTTDLLVEIAAIVIFFVAGFHVWKEPPQTRYKLLASLILILISVGFWAIYNQTFTSLTLFAERNVDREIFGFHFDTEMLQFFNPFFIISLSPILSRIWLSLNQHKKNISIPAKFTIGILFISFGFSLLALGTHYFSPDGIASAWWLIGCYFLQTIGELFLSPIGLAMVTVLTPKPLVGMMMGVWFFAQAAAFALGGNLATLADLPQQVSAVTAATIYSHAFMIYALFAAGLTVVSLLALPLLNRMITYSNSRGT